MEDCWTRHSLTFLHYPQPRSLSVLWRKYTARFSPRTKVSDRQAARWGWGNGRKKNGSMPAAILISGYIYRKGGRSKIPKLLRTRLPLSFHWFSWGQGIQWRSSHIRWVILTKDWNDQRCWFCVFGGHVWANALKGFRKHVGRMNETEGQTK